MKMMLDKYIKNDVSFEMSLIIKMKPDVQMTYGDNILWNVAGLHTFIQQEDDIYYPQQACGQ